jgi:hypothetical protein
MLYFLTFGILASGFPLYIIFPVIFGIYVFLLYMQFNELGIGKEHLWYVSIVISLIDMFLLLPFIFVGSSHEIIAVVPTIGSFAGGSLITLKEKDNVKWQIFIYNLLIFVVILIAIYISWF